MFSVSFLLYYYTCLYFTLFIFDNVKKGEKKDGCFCCFSGYQRIHSINFTRKWETYKLRREIKSQAKTSHQCVLSSLKGGDCEEDVFIFLSLVLMKIKVYLRTKNKEEKDGIKVSTLHKFLHFNGIGS